VLVLLDETIEQVRIAPAQTAGNYAGLGIHSIQEVICSGVHATGYTGECTGKMQGGEEAWFGVLKPFGIR
jgi:hypothetical protein